MKNTTFKKKALLSSVAMLLVAIVALGSATFAWFTQNKTVTAEGLKLEATTAAGLQILSKSAQDVGGQWGRETVINAIKDGDDIVTNSESTSLGNPLSYNYDNTTFVSSGFSTTTAADETAYNKAGDASVQGGQNAAFTEELKLRASIAGSDVVVKGITVTIKKNDLDTTNLSNAIRVMLVNNTTEEPTVIGTWSLNEAGNAYISGSQIKEGPFPNTQSGTKVTTDIAVSNDGEDSVSMYVWLDGEDEKCYTRNVNNNLASLIDYINVEFTL